MKEQYKRNYIYIGFISLVMMVMFSWAPVTAQTLSFGANGKLIYNAQTGTANVTIQDNVIVSNAYATVVNGGVTLNSKNYTSHIVMTKDTTDAFGTGKKMTVTSTATGLPTMQQIFYAYEGKNYLLTDVIVRGSNISTNYMAPFISEQVNIQATGDNRVLFVPFDNDTFIRYQSKSLSSTLTNTSSEVTAYYENNSRAGLIVGSVEHTVWKTGVRTTGANNLLSELTVWGGYSDKNVTRDGIAHGVLAGDSVKSPKIFIGIYEDWRVGLDDYGKANAIAEPRYIFDWTNPVPFGWNSWGAIQDKLNLDKAKAVAQFFSASLPKFRNGETAYIDLDSYWDNMVSGGIEGDFTQLIAFVNYCKERNLKPGIYWAPFVDWGKTSRPVEGTNGAYNYLDVWTKVNGAYHDLDGARAMDPTHPATQKRIELLINKFKSCGFEMIKIDFIGHAAIEADDFYDPTVTTGMQAFRKGMEYLVDKLDGKMLVYVAISPSLATGRYAHSRRIACDAYSDIGATEYTLNSTTYGWWQTHIYNFIDADHLVFSNKTLGENRARLTSGVINGTLITGDDFSTTGQWTDRAKDLLQKEDILAIAKNGIAFTPVEGNAAQSASEAFVNKIGDVYYVALINYADQKTMDISLIRLGIPTGEYTIRELFRNMPQSLTGSSLKIVMPARDASIFRFVPGTVTSSESETGNDTTILYPNPTSDAVKIRNDRTIRSFKLSTSHGDVLLEKKNIKSKEYEVRLSAYAKGIYFISVVDADGNTRIFKVVKE